ncbi:S41 family peptidase [Candidatus Saccharibacteria bacterium]|nr:S41 family peptidase [Candidatus Saccharibacteria bacterium]
MTKKQHADSAHPHEVKTKAKKPLSNNLLFMIIAATAVLGFFAGTRSEQILSVVGPAFGLKVYAGDIDLRAVQSTYKALRANYDGKLDDKALAEGANRGLVSAAGDKYTSYMNAKETGVFENDLSGNIGGGIGAEIGLRKDKITIIRTLKSNPAEKAGLNAGDTVMGVNDQATSGWTVERAVAQIRGEVGTTVKLSILRGSEIKEFTVTRAEIVNPSVSSSIKDGVGTLTISRFDSETAILSRAAARDFKQQGVKGVILDLRGNGGGYLEATKDVAGLWLDNKVVVSERTDGKVVDELKSGSNAILSGIPTVVLVNASTASASEIVAGALQDHGAAKLVGEKTFGKGSVQKLIALPDGAQLKVTIARWFTPNGKNITKEGIKPDTAATLTQEAVDAGTDPQLDAARKLLGL